MQRRSGLLIMWSVVMLVAFGAVPRVSAQSNTVRCESRGAEREQCAIERGARVELARQLSSNPCRQNSTWGVGSGYIWVSGGCRADFAVSALSSAYPTGPGNANATPMQLRACRSEADRRLPGYSYEQVEVEPYHREGSTAWVTGGPGTTGACARSPRTGGSSTSPTTPTGAARARRGSPASRAAPAGRSVRSRAARRSGWSASSARTPAA